MSTNAEHQRTFKAKMRANGLMQITEWVPTHQRELFREIAAALRDGIPVIIEKAAALRKKGPRQEAEERLRAAAPDLLQALKLLLPLAETFERQASKGTGGRRGGPVFARARAAIQKATEEGV